MHRKETLRSFDELEKKFTQALLKHEERQNLLSGFRKVRTFFFSVFVFMLVLSFAGRFIGFGPCGAEASVFIRQADGHVQSAGTPPSCIMVRAARDAAETLSQTFGSMFFLSQLIVLMLVGFDAILNKAEERS